MRKTVGWVSACRATELGCCGSHVGGIGGQECVQQNLVADLATSQQSRKNELSHRCVLDTLLFISACTAWLGWVVTGGWWWVSLIKHPEDPTALPPTPTGWPSSAMPLPGQPTSLRSHDRFSTDPDRLDCSIAITTHQYLPITMCASVATPVRCAVCCDSHSLVMTRWPGSTQ